MHKNEMGKMKNTFERYDALDGLRVIAMLGILIMHVAANVSYKNEISSIYRYVVHFGDFTALFMLISAFSISCGYYERIKMGGFSELNGFYSKRYKKIFPFFFVLTLVDVILGPSVESIYEGVANTTLAFGLIPHQSITVIGVGWTLGVIFVFYLLYPFFIYCMMDKTRFALLALSSFFFAFVSNKYFGLGKVDFLYCAIYFVTGCGLYLYRDKVKIDGIIPRIVLLILLVVSGYLFFNINTLAAPSYQVAKYIFITLLAIYAIAVSDNRTFLSNKVFSEVNKFSFEIYLCHMAAFRLLEKLKLLQPFENSISSYIIACVIIFLLSFLTAYLFKYFEKLIISKLQRSQTGNSIK